MRTTLALSALTLLLAVPLLSAAVTAEPIINPPPPPHQEQCLSVEMDDDGNLVCVRIICHCESCSALEWKRYNRDCCDHPLRCPHGWFTQPPK